MKLTRSRRDAAQAWCEIAKALAGSPDPGDRKLAESIVQYARFLPGARYKPPEQQAQRELPTMERGRAMARANARGAGRAAQARYRVGAMTESMRRGSSRPCRRWQSWAACKDGGRLAASPVLALM